MKNMRIETYDEKYKEQIIGLILHIQNDEAGIALPIEEQPDLLDIAGCYEKNGGEFWTALEGDEIIGTIAFMNYGHGNAVLKKFFVRADKRGKKIGLALHKTALERLTADGYKYVLLDTPSAAKASHGFYENSGFRRIEKHDMPFEYSYPDRDSYLYLLEL